MKKLKLSKNRMTWQIKKLGEVLQKTENTNPLLNPEKEFFYVDVSGVSKETLAIENTSRLKGKNAPSRARKKIRSGDIIFATVRPTLRRIAVVPNELDGQVCSTGYFVFRPSQILDSRFLFYFLVSDAFDERMAKLQRGASYPAVTDRDIKNEHISFPEPIQEQKRIAKILDEAFEDIEKIKVNAEKNLKNAHELFELFLHNTLLKAGDKWGVKTLEDVCERVEYGTSAKSEKEGKVPVLRMGNIQNGRFDWKNLVYSSDADEIKKYLLRHNDVLFNRTNSPELVGKTAIYKSEMPAIFAGYLIRIHRKENLLDADYLNYFLNSDIAIKHGKTVFISSVNQANINGQKLKSYPIPVPPLSEQKAIVSKFDELSEETKKLEAIYRKKLASLEELKKSILKKAFDGEL